jgi:hypothetical protein
MKLRPVLLLTGSLGAVPEVLVAYISSVLPAQALPSDLIVDPSASEFPPTHLKVTSALRLHKTCYHSLFEPGTTSGCPRICSASDRGRKTSGALGADGGAGHSARVVSGCVDRPTSPVARRSQTPCGPQELCAQRPVAELSSRTPAILPLSDSRVAPTTSCMNGAAPSSRDSSSVCRRRKSRGVDVPAMVPPCEITHEQRIRSTIFGPAGPPACELRLTGLSGMASVRKPVGWLDRDGRFYPRRLSAKA